MVVIYCRMLVVTSAYISAFLSSCRNQLKHTLVVLALWIMSRNDNDDDYQQYYQDFFTTLALMCLLSVNRFINISLICIYMTHMDSTQVVL